MTAGTFLSDRKDRTLGYDDVTHYLNVAQALTETMRLTREIDEAILRLATAVTSLHELVPVKSRRQLYGKPNRV